MVDVQESMVARAVIDVRDQDGEGDGLCG